jgi:hypothetical protein
MSAVENEIPAPARQTVTDMKTLCNTCSVSWLHRQRQIREASQMQAVFDRIFGVIDHFFDHELTVIWPLDDL